MPEQTNVTHPTITSKNLPPQQAPSVAPAQEAVLNYSDIVAKPLRSPNFINLKPKNPAMSLYWGNRSVGDKESGLRYDQLIAMGFKPASPDMVLTAAGMPCPPSLQRDGRIMYGDLILLIMPRSDYLGSQKWNAQSAEQRVRKFGSTQGTPSQEDGRSTPGSALGEVVRSKAAREGKITAYIPPIAETDAATADNSGIKANLAEK